jgi:hypothetical protein
LIQGFLPFCKELVPLVHRSDAGDRAGLMVQNFVCNMRRHAEGRHSRDAGATKVMQAPNFAAKTFCAAMRA